MSDCKAMDMQDVPSGDAEDDTHSNRIITFPPWPIEMAIGPDLIDINAEALEEVFEMLTPKQSTAFMRLAIEMRRRNDRSFLEDAGQVARVLNCSKIAWLTRLKPTVMPLLDRVGEAL